MRRCILGTLLTVALVGLAACASGESVGDPPVTEEATNPPEAEEGDDGEAGGEVAPADEVVAEDDEPAAQTIRDFDFANATWQDERNFSEVPLTDGAFTGEYGQEWTYTDDVVYTDVDGDGHEDALAALGQQDGAGLAIQWFLWRWVPEADGGAGAPEQMVDAVALSARCGNHVHEVAAGEGAFTVTESVRMFSDDIACSDDPPRQRTRSVAVEDDLLVQVAPVRGYGGVCGTRVNNEVDQAPASWQVRLAPGQDAPLVTDIDQVSGAVVLYSGDTPMRGDGWVMVGLDMGQDEDVAHWPCGFIIGEHAG